MNYFKFLLDAWKTRNWIKISIDPKMLMLGEWYCISSNVERDKKGNIYYQDIVLYKKGISNVKISNKALKSKELLKYYKSSSPKAS